MKISYISDYKKFKEINKTLVLGYFDGLHKAHMELFNKAKELAIQSHTPLSILTFNKSYYEFKNNINLGSLTTINQKIELFQEFGFDELYIVELSQEFIDLSYQDFINIFLKDMKNIIVGFDYTFGKDGLGNANILSHTLSNITIISKISFENDIKIGSETIKEYLKNGDLVNAQKLLDRPYIIEGTIHKKNKNYSFYTLNYIPRNGDYVLGLIDDNEMIIFKAKIKSNKAASEFLIKTDNIDFLNKKFISHKYYKLSFKQRISNNL
ncbi:FAD synthetase family protein [bacterium]|nr:FAD synthetase family protein [bacterium]